MTDERDDTQPIYERLADEPAKWFAKFLLYRNMRPVERSLIGAYRLSLPDDKKSQKKPVINVPGTWKKAFEQFDWKFRAEQYDEYKQHLEDEEIARIMTTGYAATHERVKALSTLFDQLEQSYRDQESGDIVYPWLTPDKVREMRGCLDDIAKEVGARVKKNEHTGKDGGPIEFITEWGGGSLEPDETEG